MSGANVRALHALAPAPVKAGPATADEPDPRPAALAVPVQRRTPPEGYRRALEAHRQAAPPSRVDPGIVEAVERQNRAMRELRHRAFPETDIVPDDAPAPIEAARAQRRRQATATEAAALRRAEPSAQRRRTGRRPCCRSRCRSGRRLDHCDALWRQRCWWHDELGRKVGVRAG